MKFAKLTTGAFRLALVILVALGATSLAYRSSAAAAGTSSVAIPASPGYTVMRIKIHYRSRLWLSRSLAQINFSRILAGTDKPWMLARLPMRLNEFYNPGKNEIIPTKVVYVLTLSTKKPLKSVIWSGPKDWDATGWISNSEAQSVRQDYRRARDGEYLRSFQGLVLFRVNEGVKSMRRIDPIWQVSEKWKAMVKPAWLFCKEHKAWFLGNGPALHTADLKTLLTDKNLLIAISAFHALITRGNFRRKLIGGDILKYQGVRLGAFTAILLQHIAPQDVPHTGRQLQAVLKGSLRTTGQFTVYFNWMHNEASAMVKRIKSPHQALWLDAGVIAALSKTSFQNRFADRVHRAIQRSLPPSLRWKPPAGMTIFDK